ncbi:hypothetical protein B0H19DRAFT_1084907 [Mycena capillaripes]|nr:hypothetical protein B0H19DRAFT_1084907 [Mycena capillaripes]
MRQGRLCPPSRLRARMKAQASLSCATRRGHPEIWRQKTETQTGRWQASDFNTSSRPERTAQGSTLQCLNMPPHRLQGSWGRRYTEERGGAGGQAEASHRRSEIRFAKGGDEGKKGRRNEMGEGRSKKMEDDTHGFLTRSTSFADLDGRAAAPAPSSGKASLGPSRALVQAMKRARRRRERETPTSWRRGRGRLSEGRALPWRMQRQGVGERGVPRERFGASTWSPPRVLAQVSVNKWGGECSGRGSGSERRRARLCLVVVVVRRVNTTDH